MAAINQIEEGREKKRAALLSVGSALLLVSLKTFLVVRTRSLGVLSEALHSSLEALAAALDLRPLGNLPTYRCRP